jgi:DNA-binding transcriptional MocR family regulator
MTIWTPSLEGRTGPTYRALADALAEGIASGALSSGDRLPTHRDLAWKLGVTVATITRAYQEARRRGLVEGEVGRGTFVRAAAETPQGNAVQRFHLPPLEEFEESGPVNMSLNFPPLLGQEKAFAETLSDISRSNDLSQLLTYQHSLGMSEHRASGARWLKRVGLNVSPEQVAVTCGGQHAMETAFSALCRPGDTVLCEPLTYPGMKALAAQWDLRLVPVATDNDGLLPDALEDTIRTHLPRALYTMPTLQNPVARTMPEERRRALADVLQRHSTVYVIEDDVYGLMPDQRPLPLIHWLPKQGIYLTGCSKSMAPGLRVGWITGPADVMSRFQVALRSSCWMAPPTMAEVARRWIDSGYADELVLKLRQDVRERRIATEAVINASTLPLTDRPFYSDPFSYHLWIPLPDHWPSEAFADQLHRNGLIVLPAESFAVGKQRPAPAIRVCIGASTSKARSQEGLAILAKALRSGPDHLVAAI